MSKSLRLVAAIIGAFVALAIIVVLVGRGHQFDPYDDDIDIGDSFQAIPLENPSRYSAELPSFYSRVLKADVKKCCGERTRIDAEHFAVWVVSAWLRGEREGELETEDFLRLVTSKNITEQHWNWLGIEFWSAGQINSRIHEGMVGYFRSEVVGPDAKPDGLIADVAYPLWFPYEKGSEETNFLYSQAQVTLEWNHGWKIIRLAYGPQHDLEPILFDDISQEVWDEFLPGDAWRVIPAVSAR